MAFGKWSVAPRTVVILLVGLFPLDLPALDLSATDLEATQSVQNLSNAVPLVGHRPPRADRDPGRAMTASAGFAGFPLEEAIRREASFRHIELGNAAVAALARHARAVLAANPELHLTSIVVPAARHIGEAFEGAARLEPEIEGVMLDVGSGNGYPGLPLALARPGLRAVLAEAKGRKAAFLRDVLAAGGFGEAVVLERYVERASDVAGFEPPAVLATRAVGGWDRIVPRLVPALREDARVLIWAGELMETASAREAWRALELVSRTPLPGRDRSWVWLLRKRA